MSPIIGIIASQNYPRITNSYESIATVNVSTGGAAQIDFTSIPNTFKSLQIRALARGGTSSTLDAVQMTFNGDTSSSNYVTLHQIYGSGSSIAAQSSTGNGWIYQSYIAGNSAGSNMFGVYLTEILEYASTSKNKTIKTLCGTDQNGSGYVTFGSGLWINSSTAINSIKLTVDGGTSFRQYSQFALYGIRG